MSLLMSAATIYWIRSHVFSVFKKDEAPYGRDKGHGVSCVRVIDSSRDRMSDLKKAGKTHLSLWDTVSIIVGIVIGAGIYETAPLVFKNVASPLFGLSVWALGGLLSLVGAFCYAELASTYPRS